MFEKLNQNYNECVQKVNNFNGKFDSDDLERINELKELQERIREEEEYISGVKSQPVKKEPNEDDQGDTEAIQEVAEIENTQPASTSDSLKQTKKQIFESINSLVNRLNDIIKSSKDAASGKPSEAEEKLNDLISKNKQIKEDCEMTHEDIEGAKQNAEDISQRLLKIINAEILDELNSKYKQKENVQETCSKQRTKVKQQCVKVGQQLSKQIEQVEDQLKKLEMFNPINGPAGASSQNKEFLDEISEKIDKTNEVLDELQKLKDDNE